MKTWKIQIPIRVHRESGSKLRETTNVKQDARTKARDKCSREVHPPWALPRPRACHDLRAPRDRSQSLEEDTGSPGSQAGPLLCHPRAPGEGSRAHLLQSRSPELLLRLRTWLRSFRMWSWNRRQTRGDCGSGGDLRDPGAKDPSCAGDGFPAGGVG